MRHHLHQPNPYMANDSEQNDNSNKAQKLEYVVKLVPDTLRHVLHLEEMSLTGPNYKKPLELSITRSGPLQGYALDISHEVGMVRNAA